MSESTFLNGRGSSDTMFDETNGILITEWYDNRCVTVGTNFHFDRQEAKVKRWSKRGDEVGKIDVSMPSVVHLYNKGMGGVDLITS